MVIKAYQGVVGVTESTIAAQTITLTGQFAGTGQKIEYLQEDSDYGLGARVFASGLSGTAINEVLAGTSGADMIRGFAGDDLLFGGRGNDTIYGGAGNDELDLGFGANVGYGGYGDDYISGWLGTATMYGSYGNDGYDVDSAGDIVVEYADQGKDYVYSMLNNYTLAANVEDLELAPLAAVLVANGNSLDNWIGGNDFNNTLYGQAGRDSLNGEGGNDILVGGDGADYLFGGAGNDVFKFNSTAEITSLVTDPNYGTYLADDYLADFTRGQDKLDLTGIDANITSSSTVTTDNFMSLVVASSFTANSQLRVQSGTFIENGVTKSYTDLWGNTDGNNATAEFHLHLVGVQTLAASDFVSAGTGVY